MQEAQERLERRKALPSTTQKHIEYYIEQSDEDEE